MANAKIYEVTFTHERHTGESDFQYLVQRRSHTAAIRAAEAHYKRDRVKPRGAIVLKVELAGTVDV